MKAKDEMPFGVPGIVEHVADSNGNCRLDVHGPACERTREVAEALAKGEMPPHPDASRAARCGPAKVASDAYRAGWDAINWGGKKVPVGEA